MSEPTKPTFQIQSSLKTGLQQEASYLIENLIEEGDQVLLYGHPKVGKTFLAIQMACNLAAKKDFLKWEVKKRRKVLYFNFEMGERVFAERITEYLDKPDAGLSKDEQIAFFDNQIQGHLFFSTAPRSIDILVSDAELKKEIADRKPDIIIFDTLTKLHGVDERDNNVIQRVLTKIRDICEIDGKAVAHLIVHHARKSSINFTDNSNRLSAAEIRGGSAIRGEADVILGLGKNPGGAGGGAQMQLTMESRNQELGDITLEKNGVIFKVKEDKSDKLREAFLAILKKKTPPEWIQKTLLEKELIDKLGKKQNTIKKGLVKYGLLKEVDKKKQGTKVFIKFRQQ